MIFLLEIRLQHLLELTDNYNVCRTITPTVCPLLLQELLKKCHQCMETIVKAKDQQAAEANKNASILLKELDLEKVMSEPMTVL